MKNDRWQDRWIVESRTDPGVTYTVARDREGNFGCSCKGWIFNHKKPGYGGDPHIGMVQAALRGNWDGHSVLTLAEAVVRRLVG